MGGRRGGFPQKWEEQMGACPGQEPWASFRENDFREAQPLLSLGVLGHSPPTVFKEPPLDLEIRSRTLNPSPSGTHSVNLGKTLLLSGPYLPHL